MSSLASPIRPVMPPDVPIFPLSVEIYHDMIRNGMLTEDDPVELIEGSLVFRMPKNPPHETAVGKIQDDLPGKLPGGWHLRLQAPVTLSDGEPEPDGAIVRGKRSDYVERHPAAADIQLVIEVADTTLLKDRGMKLRSYARAGIPAYWIINLESRTVEVYSNPDLTGIEPNYLDRTDFGERDTVDLSLPAQNPIYILVADILS